MENNNNEFKENLNSGETIQMPKLNNDFYAGYLEETAKRVRMLKKPIPEDMKKQIIDMQTRMFNILKEEQGLDATLFLGNKEKAESFKKEMKEFIEHDNEER